MRVIHGLDSGDLPLPRSVVTVGNFDGVHLGHQRIIAEARTLAAQEPAPCVVLTFDPHPLSVVAPQQAPARLMPGEEKLRCLAEAGADVTVIAGATPELLALSPAEFVERVVQQFNPRHVVEGETFGFGRGRAGTVQTLQQLGRRHGFEVRMVPSVSVRFDDGDQAHVSSSLIRRLIGEGRVERAATALGRWYGLHGEVTPGHRRGAGLGFPTANLAITDQLVPADGVYAGLAWLEGDSAADISPSAAAISIGTCPTFQHGRGACDRQIEAHLLDSQQDLYGRSIRIEFGQWIRRQRRFDSPEALSNQISKDVEAVRRFAAEEVAGCGRTAAGR